MGGNGREAFIGINNAINAFLSNAYKDKKYPKGTVASWKNRFAQGKMKSATMVDILTQNGYSMQSPEVWVKGPAISTTIVYKTDKSVETYETPTKNYKTALQELKTICPNATKFANVTGKTIQEVVEIVVNEFA
ncbi:MAG: hypothetical protein EKK63_01770 [Acinetobacter sp.]|uniref:hypothetical protein n=1 Tax=Acinetobacter sp. TaxID=472 RepID=UPI000FA81EAD|nr:hypothetical protein [Acinetobacter sp.]RUP42333.1 MAG: hypothetical protein EKK63_01770 [Acinetobacter sp.]